MNEVEHARPSDLWERDTIPIDASCARNPQDARELLQCLHELAGDGSPFILLRETPLDERIINHGDIDLLGTAAAVDEFIARCYSWAKAGRCHFRVWRAKEGHVAVVLFSRDGRFRIAFDVWMHLWQLDGGSHGLRFEDVAHLLSASSSGIVRLPAVVEAAIYIHHFVVQRKSISSESVRQRLAYYARACRLSGAISFADDLETVLQHGRVEEAVLSHANALLQAHNVVPSLRNSSETVRRRWLNRWRRWWLGAPRRPMAIAFMGCDGAGKTSLSKRFTNNSDSPVKLKPFIGRNLYRKSLIYRLVVGIVRRILPITRDTFDEACCLPLYLRASARLRGKVFLHRLIPSRRLLVMDRTLADILYFGRLTDEARFGPWVRLADFFGIRLPIVHFIVDFEQLHARKAECTAIGHQHYDDDMFWFHARRVPTDYMVFCNRGTLEDSASALSQVIQTNWLRRRAG